MHVLEMNHPMSNAEVLHWIKIKRIQHEQEDAENKAAGGTPSSRPSNFLDSLDKHERHLASDAYPYTQNPAAYEGKNQDDSFVKFSNLVFDRIQAPLAEKYKQWIRDGEIGVKEAHRKLQAEQEEKELTEAEMLMIHNHAPTCVEMLQPMIEDVEKRFTPEEQEVLVECIGEVYRVDES